MTVVTILTGAEACSHQTREYLKKAWNALCEAVEGNTHGDADPKTNGALKKALQRLGSAVVRGLSDTDVPDATSGFRAYSRRLLLDERLGDPEFLLDALFPGGDQGVDDHRIHAALDISKRSE